jgi:predicted dehydrogenase
MTVRWGIIGVGDVCEKKSGPGFQMARGSQLVAVMRRDAEKAEDYAKRHGVPKFYSRAKDLINDPDINAVYIATPPGSHMELALNVASAGKACYVEKPMARSFEECRRMVEAFHEARRPLFVAYYRRALPRFRKVKELLTEGRLGKLQSVSYRQSQPLFTKQPLPWRLQCEYSGGGLFLDVGSHTLDIIDFIFGSLSDVRGMAFNAGGAYDVEDTVSMRFALEGGGRGIASWNFAADEHEDMLEIFGSEGHLSLSVFGSDDLRLKTSSGVETFDGSNPEVIQAPLIQSIVDELSGRGYCVSTGHSAMRTSQVMDAVLERYYDGRDDAFWTRPESWPGRRT